MSPFAYAWRSMRDWLGRTRTLGPLQYTVWALLGMVLFYAAVSTVTNESGAHNSLHVLRPWPARIGLLVAWLACTELHQWGHAWGEPDRQFTLRAWGVRIGARHMQCHSWRAFVLPAVFTAVFVGLGAVSAAVGVIGTYLLWVVVVSSLVDVARRWSPRMQSPQLAFSHAGGRSATVRSVPANNNRRARKSGKGKRRK